MEILRRFETQARETLAEPAFDHFAGGAGDERTLADNEEAWRRLWIRPRAFGVPGEVDPSVELLGSRLAAPLVLAPVGSVGLAHPEGPVPAMRAAGGCGIGACVSTRALLNFPAAAEAASDGVNWFQLYVEEDRSRSEELLARAATAGFRAVVLTADLPVLGRRERDLRHGTDWVPANLLAGTGGWNRTLGWPDVGWAASASGLPVLVKGILTAEDALLAVEHGAAGVVVSNHGGRQVEGAVPTAVALPEVVEAVAGRLPVLVDGGLRSGADVFRALALGADAALVGRPWLWGIAADGEAGVRGVIRAFADDLKLTMTLAGCADVAAIGPSHVRPAA